MKPLVSVVVPVYNIQNYVGKCLESLVNQSYANIEVVVVDDGSIDDSGKICDAYALKNGQIKVYHKKNGGLSDARNYGIGKARGEYVALVDGDDTVSKDFVAEMVKAMDEKTDVVICGFNEVIPEKKTLSGKEATIKLLVEQENLEIVAWNKLYRRELFNSIYYPVGEKYEDTLTTYKVLALASRVKYVPKSLYKYKVREDSIMSTADLKERLAVREKAALAAVECFTGDVELKQAAEIAVLTAKLAFMDASVKGEIGEGYYKSNALWIKKHQNEYKRNKFMNKKLKLYLLLNNIRAYKVFRTIV